MTDDDLQQLRGRRQRQPDASWALRGQPTWVALRVLPPDLQQVVRLRFIEERSVEEIALLLAQTPSRVKSMQARAMQKLHDYRERQRASDLEESEA